MPKYFIIGLLLLAGCCRPCRNIAILPNPYSQEELKKMDLLRQQVELQRQQEELKK